ncbi:MAG: thioredoxin [Candidatus Delongbacteria bacterium]|nr:thioredoxin [bacterium]MBL7032686.1 thioredoxin [Candidatus Delongbacteria bacterium]
MNEVTEATFEEMVLKAEGVVLVDFWAPWCAPCRALAPLLEELDVHFGDKLKICKLNTDENMQLPGQFGIRGIPTLILFKKGEPVERVVGVRPRQFLEEMINKQLET